MTGQGIELELAQDGPAEHVGQEYVERDGARLELLGEVDGIGAAHRGEDLEPFVAGEVHQDPGIVRIVLHDQQDVVAGLEIEAVVGDRYDGRVLHRGGVKRDLMKRRRSRGCAAPRTELACSTYFVGK